MGTPPSPLKIKISKIRLRHVLSWPKLGLEPKFHNPGSYGGFGIREHTDTQTDRQDSCFISIDIIYNLYHLVFFLCLYDVFRIIIIP